MWCFGGIEKERGSRRTLMQSIRGKTQSMLGPTVEIDSRLSSCTCRPSMRSRVGKPSSTGGGEGMLETDAAGAYV